MDHLRSLGNLCSSNPANLGEIEDPRLFADLQRSIWISDKVKMLGEALDRLNVNQRTVINLAYFEDIRKLKLRLRSGIPSAR